MCATACVRVRGGVASARATGSGRRALRPRLRARCAGASRGSRSSEEEAGDAGGASSGGGLSPAPLEQTYTFHTPGATQEPTPTPATGTVFRHQTDEGREAWRNTTVTHLGEGLEMEHVRLAVVIGEFHNTLMDDCLDDAKASAEAMGSFITDVTWVPGTYEAPLVVRDYLQRDSIDAVVVLGYIEAGSTRHGEEMGATCSPIFKALELEYGKPVGMGIIGPGATAEQAAKRVAYAGNATRAAIRLARHMAAMAMSGLAADAEVTETA